MDKMIAMVEGASRKKTPNELALQIFLVALSIIFVLVTLSLYAYSLFSAGQKGIENPTAVTSLVALLICLAPTTIGALLSAIGIAGMSRLNQANVPVSYTHLDVYKRQGNPRQYHIYLGGA